MKLIYFGLLCLCLYAVSAEDSDVAGPPASNGQLMDPIEKESDKSDEQIEGLEDKDVLSQEDILNELSETTAENEDGINKQVMEGYVSKVCC